MMPNKHIIYGILFSSLVWALFPNIGFLGFFFIAASSALIDVDHYFASVISGKGWSFNAAYAWYTRKHSTKEDYIYSWILPFHSIECFIIVFGVWILASGWFANIVLFIFIGGAFHMLLDLIVLIQHRKPLYLKLSFLYTFYINYRYWKYDIKPKHLNRSEF